MEAKAESASVTEECDYVFKSKECIINLYIVVLTGDSGVGKSNILLR